jgi:hypothetical protein
MRVNPWKDKTNGRRLKAGIGLLFYSKSSHVYVVEKFVCSSFCCLFFFVYQHEGRCSFFIFRGALWMVDNPAGFSPPSPASFRGREWRSEWVDSTREDSLEKTLILIPAQSPFAVKFMVEGNCRFHEE